METPSRQVAPPHLPPLFRNLPFNAANPVTGLPGEPSQNEDSPLGKSSCQKSLFTPPGNEKDGEVSIKHKPRSLFIVEPKDTNACRNAVADSTSSPIFRNVVGLLDSTKDNAFLESHICPKCRGGCGPGCDNWSADFTDAHDQLACQETGELVGAFQKDSRICRDGESQAEVKAEKLLENDVIPHASSFKEGPLLTTKDAFSIASKSEKKEETAVQGVILSQGSSCITSPLVTNILTSETSVQDRSVCWKATEKKVVFEGEKTHKQELSQTPSTATSDGADEIDTQSSSFSRRRQRKDVLSGDTWILPGDVEGDAYSQKLKQVLAEPEDWKQLTDMWDLANKRKPLLKLRQTRTRTVHVTTNDEGLSYLDHHPELAQRIDECQNPSGKLALLRGFFFWLQHSCMEGAYKPWVLTTEQKVQGDDCEFIDGPDCEVLAVVLPLDEKKDVSCLVKPMDPVVIDLDDDDEEEVSVVSVQMPSSSSGAMQEAIQETKVQKAIICINCFKEFGMEKKRQRAVYELCGHIETCVSCVDSLWKLDKCRCPKCGLEQTKKPRAITDFALGEGESDTEST